MNGRGKNDISGRRFALLLAVSTLIAMVAPVGASAAGTFTDDDGSTFEADIEWLADAEITKGCNPPTNDRFCPNDYVTRGQMAAFLVRAIGYAVDDGGDLFTDDDGSVFETDIDKLGAAGVTKGCNPPANDRFCPNDYVTRGQMAAFLHRALTPRSASTSVNQYLVDLGDWEDFSPPLPDEDGPTGPTVDLPEEEVSGVVYVCEETPYSITKTPRKMITLAPDKNIMWLGALLQGDGYKDGIGSMGELPIRQRAPVVLSIDLLTEDTTRTVYNPTGSAVHQGIADLVTTAQANGALTPGDVNFEQRTAYSLDQTSLQMGIHGKYLGSSARADLSFEHSAAERTVVAYFVERAFTVSMDLPQAPAALFSDSLTEELLAEQQALGRIGDDNLPVFIDSVTYGRILMFSLTHTADEQAIHGTMEAVYNGGAFTVGANLSVGQREILENSELNIVSIGGGVSNVEALIRDGSLASYFAETPDLTTYRPISYTVRNVGDSSLAKVSDTTSYNVKTCYSKVVEPGEYVMEVTFQKARLKSFIDDANPYHEQDRFFLEVQAYNRSSDTDDPGTPVYENSRGCEFYSDSVLPLLEPSMRDVLCWTAAPGQGWVPLALNDEWEAPTGVPHSWLVTFDDSGDGEYNRLRFRAGSRDYDADQGHDWCYGYSDWELTSDLTDRTGVDAYWFTIGSPSSFCRFEVYVETELLGS